MCGLVYIHSNKQKPVGGRVVKRYHSQRGRGYEGFGVYRPMTDQMAHNTKEKKMLHHLQKIKDPILMFHHRMPTSPRENVRNACHPFSTKTHFDTNYILIHNGMISNKLELRKKHEALDIKYVSVQPDDQFCDSECLLWELALYMEGKQDAIEAYGTIAFICYVKDKGGKQPKLVFGRNNGNPLKMINGKNIMSLTSTGEGVDIETDMLHTYDYISKKLTKTTLKIPSFKPYSPPAGAADNFHGPITGHGSSSYTPGSTAAQRYEEDQRWPTPNPHSTTSVVPTTPALVSHIPTPAEKYERELATEIKKVVKIYLDDADGIYADASYRVLEDLELAETSDDDEVQLLKAVYNVIDDDPYNINRDSIHPDYVDKHFPILKRIGFTVVDGEGE